MPNTPVIATRTMPSTFATLAIDLRARKLASALVNDDGDIVAESYRDFEAQSQTTIVTSIAAAIFDLAAHRKRGDNHIRAIGISTRQAGMASFNELLSKELSRQGVDIRRPAGTSQARADKDALPHPRLVLSTRRVAAIAGEAWVGAAKGRRNAIVLTLGDVVEAGLMIEGQIVRGVSGRAGSVGWLALSENWQQEFAGRGCFNIQAGRQSLIRRAIESWSDGADSVLGRISSADLTPETIIRSAQAGDVIANRAINDLLEWVGRGVANQISTLNPEVVVLRGDLGLALRPFVPELRKVVKKWCQPDAFKDCRITISPLGARGVLIGAARLAMEQQ